MFPELNQYTTIEFIYNMYLCSAKLENMNVLRDMASTLNVLRISRLRHDKCPCVTLLSYDGAHSRFHYDSLPCIDVEMQHLFVKYIEFIYSFGLL